MRSLRVAGLALILFAGVAFAQERRDTEPLLRLDADGPTSFVTSLALSPDGRTLYAAGWDKVVHVWERDDKGAWVPLRRAYRVPLGPGLEGGAINAIALSPDGAWLAVGGSMWSAGRAGFREPGLVVPLGGLDEQVVQDQGAIYVFNTRDADLPVRVLRGHNGPVRALAFAARKGGLPALASAAEEWDRTTATYGGAALRLWDLDRKTSERTALPRLRSEPVVRPQLAAWSTGDAGTRVAVAWGDKLLRIWDGAAKSPPRAIENGDLNNVVAALTTGDKVTLLTGNFGRDGGRLLFSDVLPGREPQLLATFATQEGTSRAPWALTLLSAKGDGRLDHAAVVLRQAKKGTDEEYWLHLVELTEGKTVVRFPLPWKVGSGLPVLAAAGGGRHLALGGGPDHSVYLFAIDDLLNQRTDLPAPLRGVGSTPRKVTLVKKGEELGVILGEEKQELVFGFSTRTLTTEMAGWKSVLPELGGWQTRREDQAVSVWQDGKKVGAVPLKEKQAVTALALLPPPAFKVPILALALEDEQRQPSLSLYNGKSGEQLRQLTGHLDSIRSLCFSADGRLLASAADDQTVSLWGLTDLGKVLGQRGLLRGVAVDSDGRGGLNVVRIDAEELQPENRGLLEKGDAITGIVQDGKRTLLATPKAFYSALSHVAPGKKVTLLRPQRAPREVEVLVGQGIDERKPLLSLFVTRGDKPEVRKWIGWSPNGFFEASDRDAERYLGWHSNTDKAEKPTVFAEAREYRERFHKPGLLKALAAHADLGGALEEIDRPKPLPRPGLSLSIPEVQGGEAGQPLLVRQRQLTLQLAVADFPLDRVAKVQWSIDKGPLRDMDRVVEGLWSADLSGVAWQRGNHTLRAVLVTDEATPHQHTQEIVLRYQPPPPEVQLVRADDRMVVNEADFTLSVQVVGGEVNEPVDVQFRQNGRELGWRPAHRFPLTESQSFRLTPGENTLQIVAVNRNALAGSAAAETTERTLLVTYNPPKEEPRPILTLETVGSQRLEPGKAALVEEPRVRLRGKVRAENNLTLAERTDAEKRRPLAAFVEGKAKSFILDEELTLHPGRQEFRFFAKTAASKEAEALLVLDYRPPLPAVLRLTANPPDILYGDPAVREARIEARFGAVADPQVFAARLLLNGKLTEAKVVLDAQARAASATVPLTELRFGENRLQLELSNAWAATAVSGETIVRHVPVPREIRFEQPPVSVTPRIDLTARVRSPLLPETVDVEVNGRRLSQVTMKLGPNPKQEENHLVQLLQLPLDEGDNLVRLWVANAEARSLEPGTVTVRYAPPKPPPPPPEVEVLDPLRDRTWSLPRFPLELQVHSTTPLKKVEVQLAGQSSLELPAAGVLDFKRTEQIPLTAGANVLRVVAVNEGGERSTERVVTYLPRPVWLEELRLESPTQPGAFLTAQKQENGHLAFSQPVPEGRMWLHGRVAWLDGTDRQLSDPKVRVRVWVNGAPQIQSALAAREGDGLTRSFKVPVVLHREQGNHVEVQLPDLKMEAGRDCAFSLDCLKPDVRPQQLHLLIVGLAEEEPKKLTGQVMQALQGTFIKEEEGQLATPAFRVGQLYASLSGQVDHTQVLRQLNRIRTALLRRAREGALNDVVLVYYHGGENVSAGNPSLQTSDTLAIGQDFLEKFFAEVPGAPILFLDVMRSGGERQRLVRWPSDSRIGVLCSAWLGRGDDWKDDARLITALRETMPRAGRLAEVDAQVGLKLRQVGAEYPTLLLYDPHIPAGSRDLVLGRSVPR
jgi:WD40 repeat protein